MEITKQIIELLVGLVVFVTGMSMMSNGLKTSAGGSIRRLFRKIKDNRLAAYGIGAGTTAIIQSSGATSVMVIGFLGAGALTFTQGFAILCGAFLGTTVTGLLVSLSTFSFSMFLMATAFIGFILGFFKNPTLRSIGEIFVGFGILFFGLEAMKGSFTYFSDDIAGLLSHINFPLLLLLFGALLTAITQSSSATNGIVIIMVAASPSLLSSGFYLVLGATIGALMPTILAAMKSNVLSKRVTVGALITRTAGALLFTIIIWIFSGPIFSWLNQFPTQDVGMILAIFTIIYNVFYGLICMPLIGLVEKLSIRIVKDKDEEKKRKALRFIDPNLLDTPSVAVMQVKREIENMFELAKINFFIGYSFVIDQDLSKAKELEEREETIDYINIAISEYLIKVAPKANMRDERKIGAYYHVINDIERIGDHAYNFLEMAKKMKEEELYFSDKAKTEFEEFHKILEEMFALTARVFALKKSSDLEKLHQLEGKTDDLKSKIGSAHFNRIKKNECDSRLSPFHSTFLSELERVADHLTNIGYSTVNPTGDEINHSLR